MKQNVDNNSFRDFEYIAGMDAWGRAKMFQAYLDDQTNKGQFNYRLITSSGCGPVIEMVGKKMISLVSNDYLGFTQHPLVKQAAIDGIMKYGAGAGASPAIGGHYDYHELLEKRIAGFFRKEHAIIYTTGYTSNSASLQCILTKDDLVILDAGVHTSVMEGCQLINRKTVRHNDLDAYEHILKMSKGKHPLLFISGYENELYDRELTPERGWSKKSIETSTKGSNGESYKRTEVLWMNRYFSEALERNAVPVILTVNEFKHKKVNPERS